MRSNRYPIAMFKDVRCGDLLATADSRRLSFRVVEKSDFRVVLQEVDQPSVPWGFSSVRFDDMRFVVLWSTPHEDQANKKADEVVGGGGPTGETRRPYNNTAPESARNSNRTDAGGVNKFV